MHNAYKSGTWGGKRCPVYREVSSVQECPHRKREVERGSTALYMFTYSQSDHSRLYRLLPLQFMYVCMMSA